jgi:hypothetical protein
MLCCYCRTRDTHTVTANVHISDRHSDITDSCYCGACGTRAVAASTHNNDGHSDISKLLLLLDMWHTHGCCQHPQQRLALWHQWTVATVGHVEKLTSQAMNTNDLHQVLL